MTHRLTNLKGGQLRGGGELRESIGMSYEILNSTNKGSIADGGPNWYSFAVHSFLILKQMTKFPKKMFQLDLSVNNVAKSKLPPKCQNPDII